MKPIHVLLVAALGLPTLAGAQTVFKWVDANGVTNYTTTKPPATDRVAAINASPSANVVVASAAGTEEALYWRERRQRELANDISASRARRDNDELRQQLARQAAADEQQSLKAEEARMQSLYDQCVAQHRIDCVYGNDYSSGYGVPVLVAVNRRPGHGHDHGHTPPPHVTPPVLMRKLGS
ncbi:MAG TPA: DUF4124 domain-containing protein [Burkholderiales bacterium]|nr:DUF4124 domain-containing protein [Burkholderiales bacterium]